MSPNNASTPNATKRPYSFALTAHPPPTAASVATSVKVSAMPASSGRPPSRNGQSARVKTKGTTGRMQGLTMVDSAKVHGGRTSAFDSGPGLAYSGLKIIATPFMQ